MKHCILAFLRDEEGLTTVEYAIAGGLIGAGVIAAFQLLGTSVSGVINAISGVLGPIAGAIGGGGGGGGGAP
jgi:pilus assembly protein Flp/PilA